MRQSLELFFLKGKKDDGGMAAGLRYNWQDSLVVTSRLKDATWHDHTTPAATAATTIPFDVILDILV